ncbi:phosphate ABC transporter permease subunit PstC [Planococcus shenhongbingii]|uniref:Phosphate transport system permease protein n=1 Tax=Planococcus shenhongbingii TaxID=3058398 RepID=A0ABT8NDL2_9BACL|nr:MULTISPECIES: phosphate ABC transporter permease subunit PstC [unclassified Planococcus (in: firmicutes)]MDN7245767.1 phosphate ABC transporter permease subunit PstC [Planococcus sp. N017]WKA60121.1 phosphate ABC transporter permease subunit PstC [Planococcus sp. N016]
MRQSVQEMIAQSKGKKNKKIIEKIIPIILFLIASVSVLTTIGIVLTLIIETITFFTRVPITDFLFGTTWLPFSNKDAQFGIWPLIIGTLKVTLIAIIVAVPIGIGAAVYLSEYASENVRRIVKPVLEILAGIPTIVYGFFALTFVTPVLQSFFPEIKIFNAISPGIVVGIMIIPMIASLSEDAMSSVPKQIREGALAMGSTKFEVAMKVTMPAALSGIMASVVLAISRAIGETMIVSLAAGSTPRMDGDFTGSIQTMTSYIVQVSKGDAGYGTTIYYSIYAVGFTLFVFTMAMNILAGYVSKRFREEY